MSLQAEDAAVAAISVAPRVALADIEGDIAAEYYTNAEKAVGEGAPIMSSAHMDKYTICILVLNNGFIVTGTSAAASPDNFNLEIGRKIARDNAIRQLWPLMGFALRDVMHKAAETNDAHRRVQR